MPENPVEINRLEKSSELRAEGLELMLHPMLPIQA